VGLKGPEPGISAAGRRPLLWGESAAGNPFETPGRGPDKGHNAAVALDREAEPPGRKPVSNEHRADDPDHRARHDVTRMMGQQHQTAHCNDQGIDGHGDARLEDPVVVPLYPQYADSTTGSVLDELPPDARVVADFHDHPKYIAALGENVRRYWARHGRARPGRGSMLLISFHGLPKKGAEVYETQCRRTAELLAKNLSLKEGEWRLVFQSRFGYAKWLEPYADITLGQLPREGVQRVDVVCPGFVADCLETLEELGLRGREIFMAAGGREFHLIPCLNESPEWIQALVTIVRGA